MIALVFDVIFGTRFGTYPETPARAPPPEAAHAHRGYSPSRCGEPTSTSPEDDGDGMK